MNEEVHAFRSGFVALIGRPNVGKSTLLNRILGQKISITSDKPQTTRNRILGIYTTPRAQMILLDTPGLHRARGGLNRYMVEQAREACRGVDVMVYLVEAQAPAGGLDEDGLRLLTEGGVPVFLLINKIDLIPRPELLKIIEDYAARFAFAEIIPVSATTGEGVEDLKRTLLNYLPEGPAYYSEDMVTDLPERFIVAEMVREKVMRLTREEVPYGCAVTVEKFEEQPERSLVVIQALITVERPSQKGIIIGRGGSMLRRIGQEARRDIEDMLGTRVFLELFVRVHKDWTRTERGLRELGYE